MTTKQLVTSCKELQTKYSCLVDDYVSRLNWAERQSDNISEYDEATLEMIDNEITVAKQNLESKILILELMLGKD